MGVEIDNNFYNPVGEAVDIIYKGTHSGSKMRKLVVDKTVFSGRDEWVDSAVDNNNAEFLVELSRALLRGRAFPEGSSLADMKDGRYEEAVGSETAGSQ